MSPVICDYDKNRKDNSKSAPVSQHIWWSPQYHLSVISDQVTPTGLPPTVGGSLLSILLRDHVVSPSLFLSTGVRTLRGSGD